MIDLLIEDCANAWLNVWKGTLVAVTFGNPVMTMAMLESLMDDDDEEDDDGPWYEVTVWDWLH